jgi:hypothetical protein
MRLLWILGSDVLLLDRRGKFGIYSSRWNEATSIMIHCQDLGIVRLATLSDVSVAGNDDETIVVN